MSVGKKYIVYMIGMITILGTGCTDVDLCYTSVHPHSAQVKIKYEWGNYAEKPDSMYVIVSRPLNTYHDYFIVSNEGAYTDSTGNTLKSIPMKSGEYFMITCNRDSLIDVVNLDSFRIHYTDFSLEDLTLSMKFLDRNRVPQLKWADWVDFNPGYKYVTNAGAIYANVYDYATLYTGDSATITFEPKHLTQSISFQFRVESDHEATIDSAMCEIAGVCPYMNPYSLAVRVEEQYTGKMIFFPTGETTPKKSGDRNITTFSGKVSVFGLVPGKDTTAIAGPGIMQIAVYATAGTKSKVFRAGINLSQKIEAAKLLMLTEDGTGNIIQAKDSARIIIEQPLLITGGEINKPEKDGVSSWFIDEENHNIDMDI